MPTAIPALAPALLLALLLAVTGTTAGQDPFAAFQRLQALLEDPAGPAGTLPVECTVRMEGGAEAGRRVGLPIEVLVGLDDLSTLPERIRVTLGAATIEGELATLQETVATGLVPATEGDERPEAWLYRGHLELADNVHGAAAVVEVLGASAWGGCYAELADQPLAPPPGMRVAIYDPAADEAGSPGSSNRSAEGGASSPAAPSAPAGTVARSAGGQSDDETGEAKPQVIVLLPPKDRPARGRTDFDTMITTELVQSAVFYLDGTEAARDERAPFSATLDLGEEAAPYTVRVVGLDRGGFPLGEHEITVNRRSAPFDVAITRMRPVHSHRPAAPPGEGSYLHVEVSVSVPPGKTLDRVEVYRNEELVATLTQPPWTARVPEAGETGPADYVRALAVLTDGSSLEDVRLITGGGEERVNVNLVELFAVVTNPDGAPVEGLGPDDFQITWGGRRQTVERFQVADDVPLTLGLLVDTSGSMDALMVDAKQAAGRFLLETLIEGDEAFLVDFDNRPRLLQGATGDASLILRSFTKLTPGGFTALYDAIVYSLAQIQETGGRRAVVLVTDGVDEGSRFTSRRVIHDAKRLAVPVYVISLAGLYNERGTVRRADLEAITGHTGGRTYYISEPGELAAAYDQINRELRSQYVLAFGTERFLTEDELDDIELETDRKGLEVRWTVGSSR